MIYDAYEVEESGIIDTSMCVPQGHSLVILI